MKKVILVLLASVLVFSACSKFNKVRKEKDPIKKYEAAIEYYEKKQYDKTLILLEEVEPLLRGKKEGEKAQFITAQSYYKTKQYEMASYTFKRFYETYPRSEWAEEALYMHAYSLYNQSPESELDQKPTLEAIQSIQAYLNAYPQSKRIEEANSIIKELRSKLELKAYQNALVFYKNSNYKAAIQTMSNFEKDYPDSDFMEEVMYKKLETAYNLARQSIASKQIPRLIETLAIYEEYKYKFPQSRYIKDANNIAEATNKQLAELRKIDTKNTTENQTRTETFTDKQNEK
ncbi:MAG: outer membrane protein assembly factor BamD [Raineya sp.]